MGRSTVRNWWHQFTHHFSSLKYGESGTVQGMVWVFSECTMVLCLEYAWYSSTPFCSHNSEVTQVGGGALVPTQCSLATSGCLGLCSHSLSELSQPPPCMVISRPSAVLLVPRRTWSNMSISFFYWEVQSWRLFLVQADRCPMVRNNPVFWLAG